MEEQKKSKVQATEVPELSYDELKGVALQLKKDVDVLRHRLQMAEGALNTVNQLDYLLKIIEIVHSTKNNTPSFSEEFVTLCIEKVQTIMTPLFKEPQSEEKEA